MKLPEDQASEFANQLLRKLEAESKINPEGLAQLFQLSNTRGYFGKALLNTLHKFLLKRTIKFAREHTSYYQGINDYSKWIEIPGSDPPDIQHWPVINRETVNSHFEAFIADNVTLRSVCHTSGTTGTPLNVYKSFEEIDFVAGYYLKLLERWNTSTELKPLSLFFPNSYHGVPVPIPGVGMAFVGGVTDDTLIKDAHRVLSSRYEIPGYNNHISLLSGLEHHVQLFTSYLLEQGIDPRQFRLHGVTVTGGFVAPHWRNYLAEVWGASVNDRFTLTETIGGASRCHNCGLFHFEPHMVVEVINVDTLEVMNEGVGSLLVTNLHPFIQMQPLIRYDTGDLVYRSSSRCTSTFTFEFLGKLKNAVYWKKNGTREWLIFSAKLNEILAEIPDVRLYEWFSNVRAVKDRTVGSLPIISIKSTEDDNGHLRIILSIELRYAPHRYPNRRKELASTIVKNLCAIPHTSLGRLLESKDVSLDINFVGPGVLKENIVIKI